MMLISRIQKVLAATINKYLKMLFSLTAPDGMWQCCYFIRKMRNSCQPLFNRGINFNHL